MTDSNMTATQKREAVKIAKRKVTLAQEGLIAKFTREVLHGEVASPEAQKAYKAYKRALDKATEAKRLADDALKLWYFAMGMTPSRYANDTRHRIIDGKVHLIPSDARNIEGASLRPHNRRTKPSVDEVIESLRKYETARPLVDKLEALQEFIEIDLPTDMWLSTTDAYKALSDIDATIAGILND